MATIPARFTLGNATVSILRLGALQARLADWLRLDPAAWPEAYRDAFAAPISVPIQCVHLALSGRSLLIDACHPQLLAHVGTPDPDAAASPGLRDQLAAVGVDPADIDTVAITHPHFDHYCGLIDVGAAPAGDRLLFPNARHLLGRADGEQLQADLANPATPVGRALGLVDRAGRLDLIDGARDLGDGIRILPTPGETPGHQAVRVESGGAVLYILDDLYHHPVEVAHPDLGVHWADPVATAASRAQLVAAALAERALLIAAHIPGVGRLTGTADHARWEPRAPAELVPAG
ncbi:MBL fold metallo-hydrolase [Oscillochloris sp. ZM17-4]|uniref:MBL fold metallo-hydrolase n=1 Tax=Oscillochloris sp. ZM17-4 TaxID=2866714 RepID=UPI001C7359DF|nr:MBL fold metallo-hydrolase [Oscillochloris sp. ZM17-4]MBX0331070.1 MBL fold metallo-hydrolase [Oscillochloris sp. ZM17-4]